MLQQRLRFVCQSATLFLLLLAGLFFAIQSTRTVSAVPPPGFVLGQQLFSSGTNCNITVNTEPVSALFTSKLYVDTVYPPTSPVLLIADNHVPTTVTFPSPPTGTELVFFITVNELGDQPWYIGPATRNSDSLIHAAVKTNGPTDFTVGFEDLVGGGDLDYDDVVFTMKGCLNTTSPTPTFCPNCPVGGTVTLAAGSAGSAIPWLLVAGLGAFAVLAAGFWYGRRRWSR